MIERILIAGGGTGGHVYPAVAVAEEILHRNPTAEVVFIGTRRGMEARILPALGYTLRTISVSRLKGGGFLARLMGLARIPVAMFQSWRIMVQLRPQVVLGVGGYASGPTLLAAWFTCRRTAIQEQNATPGMTNRILGKFVRRVFLGFPGAASHFKAQKVTLTGNPLRRAVIQSLHQGPSPTAASGSTFRILLFGGSQGARFLNERVPSCVAALQARHPAVKVTILHQTGANQDEETAVRYRTSGLPDAQWEVLSYIDDMPASYATSDVAITRAGALTIAELTAVGLPSLLIPFPHAADNHQVANAQSLAKKGACKIIEESGWKEEGIVDWLSSLAEDRSRLTGMSQAAHGEARLNAAPMIVDHLEEMAA